MSWNNFVLHVQVGAAFWALGIGTIAALAIGLAEILWKILRGGPRKETLDVERVCHKCPCHLRK